jgi:hypothetical protein
MQKWINIIILQQQQKNLNFSSTFSPQMIVHVVSGNNNSQSSQ